MLVSDGCHIKILPEKDQATDYYNFKGWYSLILFALVDYRFRFMYTSVGAPGRCNDSQLYEDSQLKKFVEDKFKERVKNICGTDVPMYLIGDSAFRLSETMMKPHPFLVNKTPEQENFNYHLSKCRRVVENAFGHLKARFRIFGKGLETSVENGKNIIQACCIIHNFLNDNNDVINQKWLETVQQAESSSSLNQPPTQERVYERSLRGQQVRDALGIFLSGKLIFFYFKKKPLIFTLQVKKSLIIY